MLSLLFILCHPVQSDDSLVSLTVINQYGLSFPYSPPLDIFSSGASTPTQNILPFQNDSQSENITNLGLYQTCLLGSNLRNQYAQSLGDEPDFSRMLIESTDTDRTILSGTSIFSCLFPHTTQSLSYSQSSYPSAAFSNGVRLNTLPVDMSNLYEDYILNGYQSWFAPLFPSSRSIPSTLFP